MKKLLLFILILISPALFSQGPAITFGGKKKDTPILKSELATARKLSAFYFWKNKVDSVDLEIKSYTVAIIQPGGMDPSLTVDSHTDFFPTNVEEQLHAAPAKTKIRFTNVKAAASKSAGTGVRILPDLSLVVKDE